MTSSAPRYGNVKGVLSRVPLFGGSIASFENHHKITDLRPELLSPFSLLFTRHLEPKERVGDMIFDEMNDIWWLKKLREAKWFLLGKSTDKLGKKNTRLCKALLQGTFLRDCHSRSFPGARKCWG